MVYGNNYCGPPLGELGHFKYKGVKAKGLLGTFDGGPCQEVSDTSGMRVCEQIVFWEHALHTHVGWAQGLPKTRAWTLKPLAADSPRKQTQTLGRPSDRECIVNAHIWPFQVYSN